MIACIGGLKDFPDAINTVFPEMKIQLCIVHMVRNSLKYVTWKDYKAITADLKLIYQLPTEQIALQTLANLEAKWQAKYPLIVKIWQNH